MHYCCVCYWLLHGCLAGRCFRYRPRFLRCSRACPSSFPAISAPIPGFRTEWWYVTGWLETPDKKPLGFQITFFRVATEHDRANPSRFAPRQLIIAHAALSDPAAGKLLHDQKSAREGFGLAYTKEGNTDVKLDDWNMVREENGRYQTTIKAGDFIAALFADPTQAPMLQEITAFHARAATGTSQLLLQRTAAAGDRNRYSQWQGDSCERHCLARP